MTAYGSEASDRNRSIAGRTVSGWARPVRHRDHEGQTGRGDADVHRTDGGVTPSAGDDAEVDDQFLTTPDGEHASLQPSLEHEAGPDPDLDEDRVEVAAGPDP